MNMQTSVAPRDGDHRLSRSRQFRELQLEVPDDLPVVDLAELYTGLESMMETDRCPLLHLLGVGSDCVPIAMDLAWTGAAILGRRVMVMNCASVAPHLLNMTGEESAAPSPESVLDRIIKVAGLEIYLVDVVGDPRDSRAGHALSQAMACFDAYSGFLDMVFVVTPPAESDPLGALMARHAHANLMVLEADQTQRAEAIREREMLLRTGRPLLGAILNNRSHQLPSWLSRRL